MSIKLLLLDLDDTTLRSDLTISPAVAEAIAAAAARGVKITLATGRMFPALRRFAHDLNLDPAMPLIAYNGALARPLSGRDLWHEPVPNGAAQALLSRLAAEDVSINIYLDDRLCVAAVTPRVKAYAAVAGVEPVPVGDLAAFLGAERPTKMLAHGRPELLADLHLSLRDEFAGLVDMTFSKPYYLEFLAPGISKAAALERLAAHFHLPLAETMAVGDAPNDLSMLKCAGVGVAVANAEPAVLAAAAHKVPDNDHDGVAEAIERFILSA